MAGASEGAVSECMLQGLPCDPEPSMILWLVPGRLQHLLARLARDTCGSDGRL